MLEPQPLVEALSGGVFAADIEHDGGHALPLGQRAHGARHFRAKPAAALVVTGMLTLML